jgi:hypothetical protein
MPLSGFLAHKLPPSIDSCWLGFGVHSSSGTIQSLPFLRRSLHLLAWKRAKARFQPDYLSI